MQITTKGTYDIGYSRLSRVEKSLTRDMIELFVEDMYHPSLRNHPLDPPLERYRSISIDADLRIILRMVNPGHTIFIEIGTHDQLYNSK